MFHCIILYIDNLLDLSKKLTINYNIINISLTILLVIQYDI